VICSDDEKSLSESASLEFPEHAWTRGRAVRTRHRPVILPHRPRLGAYRLCAEIATGGMAKVYLADTPGHAVKRPVAIKRIHPHLAADPGFLEMFFDEATIASQINHAHVCHVFDFDCYEDHFIAMEYLIGEPLSRIFRMVARKKRVDQDEYVGIVARIIADASQGLHAAHELMDASGEPLNVVHRDVSPENIFVTYEGVVKIVDFGIASASQQLHKTRTGMLKGKYAYLQPEVIRGHRPDRRGDIWGLGVVMWELLTRQRLFLRETDFQTLQAVINSEIVPPSAIDSTLPPELDAIVMKALQREPDERYETARMLSEDLMRFLLKRGQVVSLGHLSDWLGASFPGGRLRQQQLVDIVLGDVEDEVKTVAVDRDRAAALAKGSLTTTIPESLAFDPLADQPTLARDGLGEPSGLEARSNPPVAMSVPPTPHTRESRRAGIVAGVAGLALLVSGATLVSQSPTHPEMRAAAAQSGGAPREAGIERSAIGKESVPLVSMPTQTEVRWETRAVTSTVELDVPQASDETFIAAPPIQLERGTYVVELDRRRDTQRSNGLLLRIRASDREEGSGYAGAAQPNSSAKPRPHETGPVRTGATERPPARQGPTTPERLTAHGVPRVDPLETPWTPDGP
jgi:serine/threonine protein kinase